MNIVFYTWDKPYKMRLCKVLSEGAAKVGHNVSVRGAFNEVEEGSDVAVFIGCNRVVRDAYDAYRAAGKHTVYIDKGYLRYAEQGMKEPREYYRVAVDCFQPSSYVMELGTDSSRWERERIEQKPWRTEGSVVLYADASDKYKEWFKITPQDTYDDLSNLTMMSLKTVVYRSRNDATRIYDCLKDTWLLVTRGSNATVDAILYGVPVLVTGESCISLPLTSGGMVNDEVCVPSDESRYRWLCGLSWCQFTPDEFESGMAWKKINERLAV